MMNSTLLKPLKIGVFDSGVGGLSVLRAIHELMPNLEIIFFADQAHVPYGRRQLDEIRSFSQQIAAFLLEREIDLLVVACNTASAAALKSLRQQFPSLLIVGMEPAVKPASEQTLTKAVGVLATPATFQGELYQSLVQKYGEGLQIFQETCPGLVEEIEAGNLSGERTRNILNNALHPMIKKNVDTIVLGCTHYPFVLEEIRKIAGKSIQVIDPAPAVARRVQVLLDQYFKNRIKVSSSGSLRFFTSGDPLVFQKQIKKLIGSESIVHNVLWQDGKIQIP
ncbi:MAG: glutamate racemase [Anaerolineaceae bacterium]